MNNFNKTTLRVLIFIFSAIIFSGCKRVGSISIWNTNTSKQKDFSSRKDESSTEETIGDDESLIAYFEGIDSIDKISHISNPMIDGCTPRYFMKCLDRTSIIMIILVLYTDLL